MRAPSVDKLARRLAESDPQIYSDARVDAAFDGVARALGAPVTRRRAVALIGAAVAAGSLLRPGRAQAQNCWPGGPKICEQNGRRVCVSNDLACCSNDNCAIACPYPWRVCEAPANCADTASMCTHPDGPGLAQGKTKFCSKRVAVTNGCVDGGTSMSIRGWCCAPTEACGQELDECLCLNPCGDDCCKKGEQCVDLGLLQGKACKPPCPKGFHYEGSSCVCDKGQTCGLRCCPAGQVCDGNTCVKPSESDKLPGLFDSFKNFSDVANQSSATHGGGGRMQRLFVAQASGPEAAALRALAAVNAQGVVAGSAFATRSVDRSFRRKVVAARPARLRMPAGAGLDAESARALEALVAAESKGFALAIASATALARSRGALRARNKRAARKQALAAASFADKAARALRAVPALRAKAAAALKAGGTTEVVTTPEQVLALQTEVRATGLPAELRDALRRLGVRGDQLGSVRDALLLETTGGPALIGPLTDPARTRNLKAIASELARFSKSARRRPIKRTRGMPKRVPPPSR